MNRKYKFGKTSMTHIQSVHADLQDICHGAQHLARYAHPNADIPDWGYSAGYRTVEEQQALFAIGRTDPGQIVTHIDGIDEVSSHQKRIALDFYAYINGQANYDYQQLAVIAALHMQAAADLGHRIEWGGTWQSLCDGPHIQLMGDF